MPAYSLHRLVTAAFPEYPRMSPPPEAAPAQRRPIASRSSRWAIRLAAALARSSVTPNQISVLSIAFAGLGGLMLGLVANPAGWIVAAVCIQLRLVCNLLDGMVAIEGGKTTKLGSLYNEFPDRIADTLFLVPAGYAAGLPWLGWAAALAAALTAYIRVFGGSLGLAQSFAGIMAKQRRMALLTIALLTQSVEWLFSPGTHTLIAGLALIAAGSAVTCVTRTLAIARELDRP